VFLGIVGLGILRLFVNTITMVLTFVSLIGYAVIYTMYLKRATPQNIVIGWAAGAAPQILGWTAISGTQGIENALLLFLIVFIWTPQHFWALAIFRVEEYKKVDVPMLPVTHGLAYTWHLQKTFLIC
jgi:protoheme IX farnesyltransferase